MKTRFVQQKYDNSNNRIMTFSATSTGKNHTGGLLAKILSSSNA